MHIRMSYKLNISSNLYCIICSVIFCLISKMFYTFGHYNLWAISVKYSVHYIWFVFPLLCWQVSSFKVWFFWERKWRKRWRNWWEEKAACCFKASCYFASIPSKADEGGCGEAASTKERDNHLCQHDWTSEANPASLGGKNIWQLLEWGIRY